jgi:hypothetical protein
VQRDVDPRAVAHLVKIAASPDADLDSRIDGTGELRFHEGRAVITMTVDELEPPVRVPATVSRHRNGLAPPSA